MQHKPTRAKMLRTKKVRITASRRRLTASRSAETMTLRPGSAVTDFKALKTLKVRKPLTLPKLGVINIT